MNGAKIYHNKFGNLETIKLRHISFARHGHHGRYASFQATSIVQFHIKILSLLRGETIINIWIC